MSPNVGNFVHDLVEMAKAMETLPQVEQELSKAKADNDSLSQTVQSREEAIIGYKRQIEELQSKVRATEAERDDAELRFLELDEKAHKVLAHVAAIQAGADAVKDFLEPPKPQPEPVKEPEHKPWEPSQGQGEGNPPTSTTETPNTQTVGSEGSSSGQSENHPTSSTAEAQSSVLGASDTTKENVPTVPAASATEPSHGPYYGKRYHDVPSYVSLQEWREGGGTDEDYYWHPTPPVQRHSW